MKKSWEQHKADIKRCAASFDQQQDTTRLHLWAETLKEAEVYINQKKLSRLISKKTRIKHENELAPFTRAYNSAQRKFEESQTIYTRLPTLSQHEHLGASLLPPGPTHQEKSFKDYGYEKEKNFWCCCKFFGKPQPKKPNSPEEGLSYTQLVNR